MNRTSRLLTAIAALTLIGAFFLPLWKIELQAPQYPEGIGMYIAISDIQGFTEFDLDKINNLNHYIGMKAIEPASIPELRFMPWILGGLIVLGLAVAAIGRKRLLQGWLALLLVAAAVGLADFYRWGYDYGHDLAADAIIKVPGMAYQPPVIGRKQLLNFVAESWPASGGILMGVAFLLGVGALNVSRRERAGTSRRMAAGAALAVAACAPAGPQTMAYDGSETCSYCSMAITDSRFGAQVITSRGRVEMFDSIECLAGYVGQASPDAVSSVWVTDFANPGTLLSADTARFVRVTSGPGSPMGMGLRAFSFSSLPGGAKSMGWTEVLSLVDDRELAAVHSHGGG